MRVRSECEPYVMRLQVSDRQSFLVVSLLLCLCLGLMLCIQCCRSSTPPPPDSTSTIPKSNNYPSPKRYGTGPLYPHPHILRSYA